MIPRRQMLTAGLLGGAIGALADAVDGAPAEPAALQSGSGSGSERATRDIAETLRRIRDDLQAVQNFPDIRAIRDAQRTYLRANGRFPDHLEVGIDVWFAAHDWHVKWQQPLTLGRDPANRYTIAVLATTVIMRTDMTPDFVGLPYDNR
jgi:hypothetical protein